MRLSFETTLIDDDFIDLLCTQHGFPPLPTRMIDVEENGIKSKRSVVRKGTFDNEVGMTIKYFINGKVATASIPRMTSEHTPGYSKFVGREGQTNLYDVAPNTERTATGERQRVMMMKGAIIKVFYSWCAASGLWCLSHTIGEGTRPRDAKSV